MKKPATQPSKVIAAAAPLGIGPFTRRVGIKALFAAIEWLAHCAVVAVVLLGIRGLELFVNFLWSGESLLFLGWLPLHDLFATADFILLAAILVLGVACVIRAYRGEE